MFLRRYLRSSVSILVLLGFIFSAFADTQPTTPQLDDLPDLFKILQVHEVSVNALSVRSTEPVALEHYEIPLRAVETDISSRLSENIKSSLIFEKNGEKYVRWIINPEDTKWHLEVAEHLRSKNIPVVKGQYFTGYQTASRSYLVIDPKTKATFSLKVSTNHTGGQWTDKKQEWEDAKQIRTAYDYVFDAIKKHGQLKHAIVIDEPAAFGLPAIDQAMVVRTYDVLERGNSILIPGFSVLHGLYGERFAARHNSNDPAAFWNEHYNKPLARAMAELYAITGMQYDSPHSQNFLVELDFNGKPTGRIAFRDFGDAFVNPEALEAHGRPDLAEKWDKDNIKPKVLDVGVGLLHGNYWPKWIPQEIYQAYAHDFFKVFESEFKRITGSDIGKNVTDISINSTGTYYTKYYPTDSVEGQRYLNWLRRHSSLSCRAIFKQAM